MQYQHQVFRAVTMFRGAMVSLIYTRTLKLQAGIYDESAALTLMSADLNRITNTMIVIVQVWAQVVEVALGIWLLERQLGWVCVAPIVVVMSKASTKLYSSRLLNNDSWNVWVNPS